MGKSQNNHQQTLTALTKPPQKKKTPPSKLLTKKKSPPLKITSPHHKHGVDHEPSHRSMHQGSIAWIYGSIQGDALTSFSWHCEARWCEEGTGPYATTLGGKERISCGWGEGGWMNQWWVIRDPDRINGCFFNLLTKINGIWIGVYKPSYKPLIY